MTNWQNRLVFESPSKFLSLQLVHQQLEQSFSQAQQILDLQMKLLQKQEDLEGKLSLSEVANSLVQKQRIIRQVFTQQLLKRQVQVERERQMKQMIGQYQKRIYDLRSMLISKEAEIHSLGWEPARDVLRRDNLKALNTQSAEHYILLKVIQERKKLNVQIEALKHTLLTSYSQKSEVSFCKSPAKYYMKKNNHKDHQVDILGKENYFVKNGIAEKAAKLLIQECQRQVQLNKECLLLKQQLDGIQNEKKLFKKKYTTLTTEKNKSYLSSKKNNCDKLEVVPESNSQYSTSKEYSTFGNPQLLANIELNQVDSLSPMIKLKKKGMTLKERKQQKEN